MLIRIFSRLKADNSTKRHVRFAVSVEAEIHPGGIRLLLRSTERGPHDV